MVVPNPRDEAFVVGILSFEVAATMSRLVSLHRSLSDAEVSRLRSDAMRSQGVAYLNSTDQSFLLRLACAEHVEELNVAAEAVSCLSRRCRGALPVGFDRLYTDLKSDSVDPSRLASRSLRGDGAEEVEPVQRPNTDAEAVAEVRTSSSSSSSSAAPPPYIATS